MENYEHFIGANVSFELDKNTYMCFLFGAEY